MDVTQNGHVAHAGDEIDAHVRKMMAQDSGRQTEQSEPTLDQQIEAVRRENDQLRLEVTKRQELEQLRAQNEALKKTWDIRLAVQSVPYMEEWRAKDPEGFKKQWDAHVAQKTREAMGIKS